MKQKFDNVHPYAEHDFAIDNFFVEGKLLGRIHKFEYENKKITVTLPTLAKIKKDIKSIWPSVGKLCSYTPGPRGGIKKPIYEICQINISIQMTEAFKVNRTLPEGATPYQTLPVSEQTRMQNAINLYGSIAFKAFHYWIRILRWQTGQGLLGRGVAFYDERPHGANVMDPRSRTSFGFGAICIAGSFGTEGMGRTKWNLMGRILKSGKEPPIYFHWFFEGELAESNGNIRGAIANYAISCESFLLDFFVKECSGRISKDAVDVIKRQVTGRCVFDKFAKQRLSYLEKADKSAIHKLFEVRNPIVHSGKSQKANALNCTIFKKVVRKLINGRL